ncbi:MAG TPA: c-type cytochrome biogenesis protein CcsB [Desulfobacterales bacterium]|nr:c-type cytochrome biogenesis protein CcsB [Desulfobacterales bacterium]
MKIVMIIILLFYLLSTAAYVAYLFVQKNYMQQAGRCMLTVGFLLHSLIIGYGFVQSGHIPVRNLHETLIMAGWAIVCVFLVFQYKYRLKILGIYAAPLSALVLFIAYQMPGEPVLDQNLFNNFWLISHIVTIFIGEASFALACGLGVLYLIQEHAIKAKNHGFFYRRLPSLELLDTTGYASIVVGFTMLTVGLITGFVYAKSVWGRFWDWDPKEVWSGITWLIYAALLHERLTVGWRGRRSAILSIIGFAVLLFTFFGVNFFLKGHHGEFTRW